MSSTTGLASTSLILTIIAYQTTIVQITMQASPSMNQIITKFTSIIS